MGCLFLESYDSTSMPMQKKKIETCTEFIPCLLFKRPPHEKDNTNTLVEKTKNSRDKLNQNSGRSGT
jgi:hypothetical protein